MVNVAAKIRVNAKTEPSHDGQVVLTFSPDYQDGRNKEWSLYTPALSLTMTVKGEVADHFAVGQNFTLTFTPEEESS